jgi:hypothetical protein
MINFLSWDVPPVEWFREAALEAHYFGLGFVQIKVSDSERWHFYSDSVPRITGEEEVHNHRYSFISQVMAGELVTDFWREVRGNTHQLYNVSCKPGETEELVRLCGLEHAIQMTLTSRSSYWLDRDTFHQVQSPYAITRVTRANERRASAQVVRPLGARGVCPFSARLSDEELWRVVGQCLERAAIS